MLVTIIISLPCHHYLIPKVDAISICETRYILIFMFIKIVLYTTQKIGNGLDMFILLP